MTAVLPRRLFHATPLYRYDPKATDNHGIWDPAAHGQIKDYGLKPSMHSSKDVPVIFLTDEVGIATNYADCNRGEEWPVDWIVLEVDMTVIDPAYLLPDMDQEAQIMTYGILAQGYTQSDWDARVIPWAPVFKITGQVRYSASIPDSAITPFKLLPVHPPHR
ncbi:hypothetical protein [Microvirga calopogonii]|uniref:hypothetical protein n=1 Tax=Microvirga calopogonii TaxID=2078013 RepID=UPI000E0CC86E|nr:hypothetical protein [Microvirga calopogonii]